MTSQGKPQPEPIACGHCPNIHTAAEKHCHCVEALCRENPSVVHARNAEGATALHVACTWGQSNCLPILHRYGAELEAIVADSGNGYTAMMCAARHNHQECISVLHQLGANVEKANRFGLTPLQVAQQLNYKGVITKLKALGAVH